MIDPRQTSDPPQDSGAPDAVETDPGALNSAEDLDEDRLRQDPLEEAMDPPEHWSGADKYGTTPAEQARARPFGERLDEEQPDLTERPDLTGAATAPQPPDEQNSDRRAKQPTADPEEPDIEDSGRRVYAEDLGTAADVAGTSEEIQEPPG